jgi:hypothetical protein
MDGRRRLFVFAAASVLAISLAVLPSAPASDGRDSDERPPYMSKVLGRQFLGATLVDLHVETSASGAPTSGDLEFRFRNPDGLPRYKSWVVSISLQTLSRGYYAIGSLPDDLLGNGEALRLRLASEKAESADLILIGADGATIREVKLSLARFPDKGITIESERNHDVL